MRVLLLLSGVAVILSACFDTATTKTYNRSKTAGTSVSANIFPSFRKSDVGSTFYMLLERKIPEEYFVLKVRWIIPINDRRFDGAKSTLKLLLAQDEVISLSPVSSSSVIVAYNIENKTMEEEMSYTINRDDLEKIVASKLVTVELTGKYEIITCRLNKFQSIRAIKDFLKNG